MRKNRDVLWKLIIYRYSCIGTELQYRYNVLRVKDLRDEDLSVNANPFAAVMLIVKKALLEREMSEEELIQQKLAVARALIGRQDIPRRKVEAILRFLNNYIVFKKPGNNDAFKKQFEQIIKKDNPMGIIEYFALEEFMKERRKIARKLLSMNHLPVDKIAYATGLSVKEVERMQKRRSPK